MARLSSFGRPVRALVVGAGGGIGGALVAALAREPGVAHVIAAARTLLPPTVAYDNAEAKVEVRQVDILDEASIVSALAGIDRIDLAIVATGLLHDGRGLAPEKTWRALDAEHLMRSYAVNAIGPALVAKHVMPLLPREGKAVFAALSARVGSISDNRLGGWYGYRASKAALNQLIRTLAVELGRQRRHAICIGLHPGTVDSALSRPFQAGVAEGKLFTPAFAAERLLAVIDDATIAVSGQLIAWDGQLIPP